MPWPITPLGLTAELYPGGTLGWVDITDDVRLSSASSGGGVSITRGRSAEAAQALPDPGQMSLVLDNRSGRYSPRNPLGDWFGLLGRNTPIRVGVGLAADSFTRTSASGWGSTEGNDPLPWTISMGGVAADFPVAGTFAKQVHPTINVIRGMRLSRNWTDVEQVASISTPAVATGASIVAGHFARYQLDNGTGDFYWFRLEFDVAGKISAKISKTIGGATSDLAVSSSIPGLTYTAGQAYMLRSSVSGSRLSLAVWRVGTVEPLVWTLTTTDRSILAPGRAGLASWVVGGNTNVGPEVRFDDYKAIDRRAYMEVSEWPPKWDTSGFDRWTPIEAAGILRRVNQGKQPSKSPLRRAIDGSDPVLYWPVEDGVASGQVGSSIAVAPQLIVSSFTEFKSVDDFQDPFDTIRFGTSSLADLSTGGSLRTDGTIPTSVAVATANGWTVGVAGGGFDPSTISADVVLLEWYTPGGTPYVKWQLRYLKSATRAQVVGYPSSESTAGVVVCENIGVNIGFGPRFVSVREFDATHFYVDLYETLNPVPDVTVLVTGSFAGVGGWAAANPTRATSTAPMPAGHIAVWATSAPPAVMFGGTDAYGGVVYGPWASWQGETAIDRLTRLCAEEGIPVSVLPVPASAHQRVGWQPTGAFTELLRECIEVDGGILSETRDGLGLVYRPRQTLYNQAPLTLSYSGGHISPPFDPVDDDASIVNDITVSRKDGSSVRAVQTAGPLAALPPPNGIGVYESTVDLNLNTDRQLSDQAGWRKRIGTVDESRYPRIAVDLSSRAWVADRALLAQAAALDSGGLLAVGGLPAWLPAGPIKALIQGYTETLDAFDWDIVWNASPGSVWDVARASSGRRVAVSGATLAVAITSTATSLSLATVAGQLFTVKPSAFPLDLLVGGERVTVSAITGAASPQPATVSARSVNGIVRSWPAGTPVTIWAPGVVPL